MNDFHLTEHSTYRVTYAVARRPTNDTFHLIPSTNKLERKKITLEQFNVCLFVYYFDDLEEKIRTKQEK